MQKKTFWITILMGILVLLVFIVTANIISVGERLRSIHRYLEYGFYSLAFLIVYFLIINPLRVIFFAPTFTIDVLASDKQNAKSYRHAAKNLMRKDVITDEDKALLREHLNDDEALPTALKSVFHGTVKKNVDRIIIKHSKTVLTTTAISQNGNLDMLAVIMANIRMTKEIVEACGFRPSYINLGKLSVNVAVTALIAEGLEDVNFTEILPSRFGEALTDLPMVRTATNSIFQGISNGLLTCRVGIVTRKYLFADNQMMSQRELRLASYKESFRLMPLVISGGLIGFPKSVINFALKPFKKNPFAKEPTTAKGEV